MSSIPNRRALTVGPRLLVGIVAIGVVSNAVVERGAERLVGYQEGVSELVVEGLALGVAVAALVWFVLLRPWITSERRTQAEREEALAAEGRRQEFDTRLHRALEMSSTEQGCYDVVELAFAKVGPRFAAELLLADSSHAHLKRAVGVGPDGATPGCGVTSPDQCPSVRRASTLVVASSTEMDACPQLRSRTGDACSATCVPVSVAGRAIGVLQATAAEHAIASDTELAALESIADQAGVRIGLLRVMEQTHLQAATDPLTGLLNRRSVENKANELVRRGMPFALAMGDLDHFKALNDRHGHDAGDRALRLFARTIQRALRTEDLVSRYGGEEFVVIFPDRSADDAALALARVQEELLVAVASGSVPGFTVSFGVADSTDATGLGELREAADSALFRAKNAGRNRIVLAREPTPIPVAGDQ